MTRRSLVAQRILLGFMIAFCALVIVAAVMRGSGWHLAAVPLALFAPYAWWRSMREWRAGPVADPSLGRRAGARFLWGVLSVGSFVAAAYLFGGRG